MPDAKAIARHVDRLADLDPCFFVQDNLFTALGHPTSTRPPADLRPVAKPAAVTATSSRVGRIGRSAGAGAVTVDFRQRR